MNPEKPKFSSESESLEEYRGPTSEGWGPADEVAEMLEKHNPYSETLIIESGGQLSEYREGEEHLASYGLINFFDQARTPEDVYAAANKLEAENPQFKFSFETDPEGRWFKYTISKTEGK